MKSLLLATAIAILPFSAFAADPLFDEARLTEHVKVLSDDSFEGRGPATAGETKTVAYITEQYAKAGLQPGGDLGKDGKRAWTQDVPLGRFDIDGPVAASFTVGGKTVPLVQGDDIAIRASLTGQKAVSLKGAPIVWAGYGIKAPERNWDDFKGLDVKGKIIVVLINDADFETGKGEFGGKAMTYYGRWTYKYEEAARLGAAGVLIVHETAPASYGWATVKNSNTNTMFDIVRKDPTKAHTAVESWITRDVAVALFKEAGLDFDAEKKKAQSRDFQPVELKGATFSADFKVKPQVIVSKNVVGLLPGKTHPDEYVIYSGHWDHLGIGRPDAKGDTIYNGAVDNATGTAAVIEMGRAFAAGPRPDRSIVFMTVTAEEKGLLGSEYYAANPVYPLAKTVAVFNTDALSPLGPTRDFNVSGDAKQDLLDMLIAKGKAEGRTFSPDPNPEAGHFYRSDHFPFAKRGVPAISFGSGIDVIGAQPGEAKAWAEAYTKDKYHQPADEWSADWRMDGMVADLTLLHDLGSDLANSRIWPEWAEGSEFKATRDATKAERK
ncbi:MAG: M28-family zinc peptidase [Caulobacter sp.]|nr:M28-family zinc peptidase [Caulobacter sp.]